MKLLFIFLTVGLTLALFFCAVSPFGLKNADLYWKPNAWDLTIYNSDTYLIPSRIFWVPLYLLPHRTYDGQSQAVLFTLPYWIIVTALPSGLVTLVVNRIQKRKSIVPEAQKTSTFTSALPSEKSF